jgi:hypothetical protein
MKYFQCIAIAGVLVSSQSLATTYYVRAGATGNGTGADWSNAYPQLPNVLGRGHTYYVADGTYPGYTFDDPVNGTLSITIKKATTEDHGSDLGWSSAYGDGQAVFSGTLTFLSSYWVLDGQTKGVDWFDGSKYGFAVRNGSNNQIQVRGAPRSNITIQYVYLQGPTAPAAAYAIDTDLYDSTETLFHSKLALRHIFVSGSNNPFMIRSSKGTLIEYCASSGATGSSAYHGEIVNLYYTAESAIVRFNHFKDAYLSGGGTALIAIQYTGGHQIYGNIFENFTVGDAAVGFIGGNGSNILLANNTFVKSTNGGGGFQASAGTNNIVRNNLWVGVANPTISPGGASVVADNAFSTPTGAGGNVQVNVSTNVFSDYASGDYTLAKATASGVAMPAPHDVDFAGASRGVDGIWDRGAYEYNPSQEERPKPPSEVVAL